MQSFWRTSKNWLRSFREKYWQDFVFIHINKTAGSSVEKALGVRFQHMTARDKRQELGVKRWDERFKFTFVRNPWDKVVSHYHYRVRTNKTGMADKPLPFHEWVRLAYQERDPNYHQPPLMFLPQWQWICDESGQCLVDFIGRFESLTEDFSEVCRRLHRQASLPHLKKSSRGQYQDYYNATTRDIVAEWFHEDIQQFNYAF